MAVIKKLSRPATLSLFLLMGPGCSSNDNNIPKISFEPLTTGAITSPALGADNFEISGTPVDTYAKIAHGVNRCWFNDNAPVSRGYVFHANTAKDRSSATIGIYEKGQGGDRGLRAFELRMKTTNSGTTSLQSENYRLTPDNAVRVKKDIERWAQGQTDCAVEERTALPQEATTKANVSARNPTKPVPIPSKAPPPPVKTSKNLVHTVNPARPTPIFEGPVYSDRQPPAEPASPVFRGANF